MHTVQPQFKFVTSGMMLAQEVIACELQVGNTQKVTSGFLPRFFQSAKDGLASFFSAKFDFYKAVNQANEQDKILKKLADVNFSKIAPLPLATLEGFTGEYTYYGKQLLAGFSFYEDTTAKNIASYRKLLGSLLTNKSARIDLQDITRTYKQNERVMAEYDKDLSIFFARGSHRANLTVGDVVLSNSDLVGVFSDNQAIIAKIKELDPKTVQASVKEISDLVDLFTEEIEKGTVTELSSVQLNNLVEGLMGLARQIEFFSLTYYRAATYVAAVERLTEVLKKA